MNKKEKIELTHEEFLEILDDERLYRMVISKRSKKMEKFIDKIAKKGYSDGVERVEVKGKILATYWAGND